MDAFGEQRWTLPGDKKAVFLASDALSLPRMATLSRVSIVLTHIARFQTRDFLRESGTGGGKLRNSRSLRNSNLPHKNNFLRKDNCHPNSSFLSNKFLQCSLSMG